MNAYEIPYECCRIEELEAGEQFMLINLAKNDTWLYHHKEFLAFIKSQVLMMVTPKVKEMKNGPSSEYERTERDGRKSIACMSHGAMVRRVV